jgi:hypothetical protein
VSYYVEFDDGSLSELMEWGALLIFIRAWRGTHTPPIRKVHTSPWRLDRDPWRRNLP